RINLDGTTVFLQDIAEGLTGRVSVAASLQGSMKHPQGSVSLEGNGIDLGFQNVDKIIVLSTIKNHRIMVDTLKLVPGMGDEPIIGTGWVSLQGEYAFQLSGRALSLENIDVLAGNNITRGRAGIDLAGSGSFSDPSLNGEIILSDVFVDQARLGDIRITLDLHDNIVNASGKQGMDFSASYIIGKGDFSSAVLFDDMDLAPYFQIARYQGLSGTVSGKISGSGNIHNIPDIKASMDVADLSVYFMGKEIVSGRELRANLVGKEFSVPGIHLILGEKGWVNIEGGGTLDKALSLRADGDIPLQVLDPFIEDISDTSGRALVSGQFGLIDEEYVLMADLELKDIGFMIPFNNQKVHSTNGHIVITPKTIALKEITGRCENGRFDLSGTLALEDMKPQEIDLKLQASSFPIRIPDTMDFIADTEVVVRGTSDDSLMQGRVVLLEGVYYKDAEVNLIKEAVSESPETRAPRQPVTLAYLRNMKLDISINRRNTVYVDNNLAQMDINPDLHISGTVNNPVINGRASIESGTVMFRNRTFSITKGVVDFLDPYSTEATIDIESEVKVRDWMIYLGVTGTPDALNISLRSEPPEEDNDILSLIVFGRTSQELIAGEGGSTLSTSSMIASLIASRYGEDFRKASGLDILELESGADNDSAEMVKLTIGKELSRRIMLKYAIESKNSEMSQRAIAEYKLFENIVLNGFQDTRGIFGADVQYRLEFR
ncbi:MAG: translocation/assembly module TamB domain-containing protein, partial [Deltaproteobacteria bacterium]|nr:translocation/assembly module TamB domain-containing protein [Deltaproteobacteria bacterium]